MQLEALCAMKTDDDILERLGKLPIKLAAIYLDIYNNLFENTFKTGQSLIRNILKWLLCGQESLNTEDFSLAISQHLSPPPKNLTKDTILDLCCNFVIHDEHRDVFQFAHASVEEFLRDLPEFSLPNSNALLAESCLVVVIGLPATPTAHALLTALSDGKGDRDTDVLQFDRRHPLENYAARYCMWHCGAAGDLRRKDPLQTKLQAFLTGYGETSACSVWMRICSCYQDRYSSKWDRVHRLLAPHADSPERLFLIACIYNFTEVLEDMLQRRLPEDIDRDGLLLAILFDQYPVVRQFLAPDNEFVLNAQMFHEVFEETIKFPDMSLDFMQLLLDGRGAIERSEKLGLLEMACSRVEVLQMVLDHGNKISITSELLRGAAEYQKSSRIDLLMSHDPDADVTERVIAAAFSEETLEACLGYVSALTVPILNAAIRHGKFRIGSLKILESKFGSIRMTSETVEAAAICPDDKVQEQILLGEDKEVVQEVVQYMAKDKLARTMQIRKLLQQDPTIQVTEQMMAIALANEHSSVQIATVLLGHSNVVFNVTEDLILRYVPFRGMWLHSALQHNAFHKSRSFHWLATSYPRN